jgi:hypothetical protein
LGIYQRIRVQLSPHHTRISSSVPRISHHEQHHARESTLSSSVNVGNLIDGQQPSRVDTNHEQQAA